jgi:hypothetical protein
MRTLTIFVIACGLSLPGLAQEKILGAEAYGVLKSTYAYDKTYPINARKVREFKDYDGPSGAGLRSPCRLNTPHSLSSG